MYIDNQIDQRNEVSLGTVIAHFGLFNTQCFHLAIDALTTGALRLNSVIEWTLAFHGHAYLSASLLTDIFDMVLAEGLLLVLTDGSPLLRKEQRATEQYAKLAAYAAQRGQTPEMLFQEWVSMIARDTEKLLSVNTVKPSGKEWQTGHEEEVFSSPLLQVAGMFAIGEQGWADRHDEYEV